MPTPTFESDSGEPHLRRETGVAACSFTATAGATADHLGVPVSQFGLSHRQQVPPVHIADGCPLSGLREDTGHPPSCQRVVVGTSLSLRHRRSPLRDRRFGVALPRSRRQLIGVGHLGTGPRWRPRRSHRRAGAPLPRQRWVQDAEGSPPTGSAPRTEALIRSAGAESLGPGKRLGPRSKLGPRRRLGSGGRRLGVAGRRVEDVEWPWGTFPLAGVGGPSSSVADWRLAEWG